MPTQTYDELNDFIERRYTKNFDFEEYFAVMDIPDEERAKRVELARDFSRVMLYFFATLGIADQAKPYYYAILEERCKAIAEGYVGKTDLAYLNDWAKRFSKKTTDETLRHIDNPVAPDKVFHFEEWGEDDIPQNEYWTSPLRAFLIAGGMATLISGYDDLLDAVANGKTMKTWHTERDKKVRDTHKVAEGQTVKIYEPFIVGGYEMMMPLDDSLGAPDEEICSCRCHASFR